MGLRAVEVPARKGGGLGGTLTIFRTNRDPPGPAMEPLEVRRAHHEADALRWSFSVGPGSVGVAQAPQMR